MACEEVLNWLATESGRFDGELYARFFPRSPWVAFIRKQASPDGIGNPIKNLTFEARAPEDYSGWTNMFSTLPGVSGSCLPTPKDVTHGSTEREWNIQQMFLEGPDFCVTDIRTKYDASTQLDRMVDQLAMYAMTEWEFRYRHEYLRLAGLKVVLVSSGTAEGTGEDFNGIAANCPYSKLTQGVLDKYKLRLRRNGAHMSSIASSDGAAVLTLITESETSDSLIRDNADIRQDIRWASPSMLLEAIGHDRRVYRGFVHVIDDTIQHWTCTGGTYTEVFPYVDTAATIGEKSIIRSAYQTAPYTTSYIFDPTVFTSRIPKPISSIGPLNFTPVNYTTGAGGTWSLKNIPDRECNPDGTIVFYRGHLASGSEPVHPERGVAFAHLRCDRPLDYLANCS